MTVAELLVILKTCGVFMVLFTDFRLKLGDFLSELRRGGKYLLINAGIATILLLVSALFAGTTFLAGIMEKG